jgi:hypothetical protein
VCKEPVCQIKEGARLPSNAPQKGVPGEGKSIEGHKKTKKSFLPSQGSVGEGKTEV